MVIQLDEDLLGWIFQFVQSFVENTGQNITSVHPVLVGDEIFPTKEM